MARNFNDATREEDGERLIRRWKFLMLHFKADGCTKYAVEAFKLIAQVKSTLTPRMAYRLTWNRTCNSNGGDGSNISLDLHNEQLNRLSKMTSTHFEQTLQKKSVARSSQANGQLSSMLQSVDRLLHVVTLSGRHNGPNLEKDFDKVLQSEYVFRFVEERKQNTFPSVSSDPFVVLRKNPDGFQKWLKRRRKVASIQA